MCLLYPSFPVTGHGEIGIRELLPCRAVQAEGGDDTGTKDEKEEKAWSPSGQATTTVNHEGIVCPFQGYCMTWGRDYPCMNHRDQRITCGYGLAWSPAFARDLSRLTYNRRLFALLSAPNWCGTFKRAILPNNNQSWHYARERGTP